MTTQELKEYRALKEIVSRLNADIEKSEDDKNYPLVNTLKERRSAYIAKINEIENWLEAIDDPLIYTIFESKIKYGMSDEKIGETVGYARSTISRYKNDYLTADKTFT